MAKKVLIVGGGPAGASAALYLRQNHIPVSVFEKADKHRSKTCGEGLTPESQNVLQSLGMLKKVQEIAYCTDELTLFDLFNKPISLYNRYYTLQRTIFDQLLRDEIVRTDGEVVYNTTITNIRQEKDRVVIEDQHHNQFEGDAVIVATGAETNLAKQLGLVKNSYSAVSLRAYTPNTIGCHTLEFYLHRSLFPAYGWIFPLPDNLINFGVYTHKDLGPTRDLAKLMAIFQSVLKERYSEPLNITGQSRGWILNTGLQTKNIVSNRVLLAGENIACTYNFSGEGIGPAMKSGYLAAKTIIDVQGNYSAKQFSLYQKRIEEELEPMHGGYNKITDLFQSKVLFFISCFILHHFKRARTLTEMIIDEKVSLKTALTWSYLSQFLLRGK